MFKEDEIYILRAESGRKGYTCIDCKRPLEAVIKKKHPTHRSFFRHIVNPKEKNSFHCAFNGNVYLEKLVEQIIMEKGSLLLPEVVKFPPLGTSLPPLVLQETRILKPSYIKARKFFYLNNTFQLQPHLESADSGRTSHICPDLIFYNEQAEPILFIEIVITHPIDEEKKAKLIHIGIDTVQIDLPHGDREELEKLIEAGDNTKWAFNNEEFYTNYYSITSENRRELPSVDSEQRSIQQESSECRRARIRELILSIERFVETNEFGEIEQNLRDEIRRIEKLTESAKSRLAAMEEEQERGLYSEFTKEEKCLSEFERREWEESNKIEKQCKELEDRYNREATKLETEEGPIRERERNEFETLNPLEELPRRITSLSSEIRGFTKKITDQEIEIERLKLEERGIDVQLAEFDRIEARINP